MSSLSVTSPFPLASVPRVWSWIQEFRSRVADDFGPKTLAEFMERWRSNPAQRSWAVYRDGELGGLVTFVPENTVTGITHCIFKKSFWGHKTTVPALRLVYSEIFAEGFHKVCSLAFRDNVQILHMARTLGGEKEGILREHTMRNEELTDMMIIGLTKTQFDEAQQKREAVAA